MQNIIAYKAFVDYNDDHDDQKQDTDKYGNPMPLS